MKKVFPVSLSRPHDAPIHSDTFECESGYAANLFIPLNPKGRSQFNINRQAQVLGDDTLSLDCPT